MIDVDENSFIVWFAMRMIDVRLFDRQFVNQHINDLTMDLRVKILKFVKMT